MKHFGRDPMEKSQEILYRKFNRVHRWNLIKKSISTTAMTMTGPKYISWCIFCPLTYRIKFYMVVLKCLQSYACLFLFLSLSLLLDFLFVIVVIVCVDYLFSCTVFKCCLFNKLIDRGFEMMMSMTDDFVRLQFDFKMKMKIVYF